MTVRRDRENGSRGYCLQEKGLTIPGKAFALLDQGQEITQQPTGRARGIVRASLNSLHSPSLYFELHDFDARCADIAQGPRDAGLLPIEFSATEHPSSVGVSRHALGKLPSVYGFAIASLSGGTRSVH